MSIDDVAGKADNLEKKATDCLNGDGNACYSFHDDVDNAVVKGGIAYVKQIFQTMHSDSSKSHLPQVDLKDKGDSVEAKIRLPFPDNVTSLSLGSISIQASPDKVSTKFKDRFGMSGDQIGSSPSGDYYK